MVVRKGQENQLFFRFENPKNETLTAISFSVECYDIDGNVVKTEKIEHSSLKVKGRSCFVVNRPIVMEHAYADFQVTINSVNYGDYLYITHGNEVEVVYEKQDKSHEIDRVPYLHKMGGHTHKSVLRTLHAPGFFLSLFSLIIVTLFLVLGVKLYNFTRTEEIFSLDRVEYTFATKNRKTGPIIIVGTKSKAGHIIIPDKIEGHDVIAVHSKAFARSNVHTIEFKGEIEIQDSAFAKASNLQTVHIESTPLLGANAFAGCKKLTSVVIDRGLQTVEANAFDGCSALSTVSLPSTVFAVKDNAFANCTSLKTLTIPDSTTQIGRTILKNCSSLENFQTPFVGPDVEDIQTLDYFFGSDNDSSVKNLTVTKLDTIPSYMFEDDTNLETVEFSTPVTNIGAFAFSGCTELTTFEISPELTSIGASAFENCSSLESATIPNGVTYIPNNLFKGCTSMETLVLSNSLTQIGEAAFMNCSAITSLNIPSTVVYIGNNALSNCTGLTSLTLPFLGNTVQSIPRPLSHVIASGSSCSLQEFTLLSGYTLPNYAFESFTSLTKVTLPATITTIPINCFNNCRSLKEVNIPATVTSIGEYAFANCSSMQAVTIPEAVVNTGRYAFSGCSSLASAIFRNNATTIEDHAFAGCTSLTYLSLPTDITSLPQSVCEGCSALETIILPANVASIPTRAFYNCSALKSIVLPLSLTTIESSAFENCQSLPTFTFPSSVHTIGERAFSGCASLSTIEIPETITSISSHVFDNCSSLITMTAPFPSIYSYGTNFGYYFSGSGTPDSLKYVTISSVSGQSLPSYAFQNCAGVETFVLPDTLTTIGAKAFENCASLTSLVIPDNVTNLGYGALIGTTALESITLPYAGLTTSYSANGFKYLYYDTNTYSYQIPENLNTVTLTKATSIPSGSFSEMSSLRQVNFPNTLTSIGSNAFYYCTSLGEIVLPSSLTQIDSSAFYGCRRLYDVTNLSSLNVTACFENALRIFSSISERSLYTVTTGGFTLLQATDNEWYLTKYDNTSEELDLPSNVYSSSRIKYALPSYLFFNNTTIKSVNISADVTKICSHAFSDCDSLTEVTADNTSSFEEIADAAFYNTSVSSVEIPNSTVSIGAEAFAYTNITEVTFPSTLTTLGERAFYYCSSLEDVTFESGSSLGYIPNSAFANCGITDITIPASVTYIDVAAFSSCYSLDSVSFASGSQLTQIADSAFAYSGISEIEIPSSVIYIGESAFYSSSLDSISFKTGSQLAQIGASAFGYTDISTISIPSSVTDIGGYAFYSCSSLTSVSFGYSPRLPMISDYAFANSGLTSITIPASVSTINGYAFYNCSSLADVSFASGSQLTQIGNSAFKNSGVTSISFPSTLTTIDNYAFESCSSLSNISFATYGQLSSIGNYAFSYTDIEALRLPANLTYIGSYAFSYCYDLTSVTVRSDFSSYSDTFVGSSKIFEIYNLAGLPLSIGSSTYGSIALNAIIIHTNASAEALHDVQIDELMFKKSDSNWFLMGLADGYNPSALVLDSFTYNSKKVNSFVVYKNAFSNNYTLTSVTIGDGVREIMENAFYDCENLETLTFDEDATITKIANNAFAYCYDVQSVMFPDSLSMIGDSAFYSCSSLEVVSLPDDLTQIGSYAFYNCLNLYDVINWSDLNITKGGTDYGYVGCYALAVRSSGSPLTTKEVTSSTASAKFVSYNSVWYLIRLNPTVGYGVVEVPELVVNGTTYNYQIFKRALNSLSQYSYVLLPNTISKIDTDELYTLRYCTIYFKGTASKWSNLNTSGYSMTVYTYADCIHESGTYTWMYDEDGNVSTSVVNKVASVTLQPTCKDTGIKTYTCPSCGEQETETLPTTNNHQLVDDVCTVCGKELVIFVVTKDNFASCEFITNNSSSPFAINDSGEITSQNHSDSSSSTMTITATSSMSVTFSYKVSSEENYDMFTAYVNSSKKFQISGTNSSYQEITIELSAGDVLTFTYSKDSSANSGDDCAYIKDLSITLIDMVEASS